MTWIDTFVFFLWFIHHTSRVWTDSPDEYYDYYWAPDRTGTDLDPEHVLAYWREDFAHNTHHWNWHNVYISVLYDKRLDRKGELFAYFHRQIMHRYNVERLCLGLHESKPMSDWTKPIEAGYAPHLEKGDTREPYKIRPPNTYFADLPGIVYMDEMYAFRERINRAIDSGYLILPNGTHEPLDIRNLANTVEANDDCPNIPYYARERGMHNYGHAMIAMAQDPDNRYKNREMGVTGNLATAARDPSFYNWHAYIDGVFEKYKMGLTPYTDTEIIWPAVMVQSVEVLNSEGTLTPSLKTIWKERVAKVECWPDFSAMGTKVKVTYTSLDHDDFFYRINIRNVSPYPVKATVRIYLVPKRNIFGVSLNMDEVRGMYIEMDNFVEEIPVGHHTIIRSSVNSSTSIPLEQQMNSLTNPGNHTEAERAYCGCGWPYNLLLPRGKPGAGMRFSVLVMLTNHEDDKVDNTGKPPLPNCQRAPSVCGLLYNLFPDRHDMGFPFDRHIAATSLGAFIADKPNFGVGNLTIIHIPKDCGN